MSAPEQLPLGIAAPGGGPAPAARPVEPSAGRVRTLAGTLAGYRWPGRGSLDKLPGAHRRAALAAAAQALRALAEEPD